MIPSTTFIDRYQGMYTISFLGHGFLCFDLTFPSNRTWCLSNRAISHVQGLLILLLPNVPCLRLRRLWLFI